VSDVFEVFPDVMLDYDNIPHFEACLERRLMFNRCLECGYWIYPHRPMCPKCWSFNLELQEVSGAGTVWMFTFSYIGHQNTFFSQEEAASRECWAAIEFPEREGFRYLAPIVDCPEKDIRVGLRVRLDWKDYKGVPHPVFRASRGAVDAAEREA
jgi:uncharacterized protein